MSNSTQNEPYPGKFIPVERKYSKCPIDPNCEIEETMKYVRHKIPHERLPEASKTKDRALQEDWNERFDRNCDRDSKINEKDPTALIGFPGKNSPIYKGVKDFIAKERADARKEVIANKIDRVKLYEVIESIYLSGMYAHDKGVLRQYMSDIINVLATLKEEIL